MLGNHIHLLDPIGKPTGFDLQYKPLWKARINDGVIKKIIYISIFREEGKINYFYSPNGDMSDAVFIRNSLVMGLSAGFSIGFNGFIIGFTVGFIYTLYKFQTKRNQYLKTHNLEDKNGKT